jgi:hypothetical protein
MNAKKKEKMNNNKYSMYIAHNKNTDGTNNKYYRSQQTGILEVKIYLLYDSSFTLTQKFTAN